MNTKKSKLLVHLLWTAFLACALTAFSNAQEQKQQSKAAAQPVPVQQTFATAQEAAAAVINAAESYDVAELLNIFGPEGKGFVSSADPVRVKQSVLEFVERARKKNAVVADKKNPNTAILVTGDDDWPFPVPIVKRNGKWLFDSKAGQREITVRRIGTNELDAIQICRGYVEAQREYASEAHDGINQYAQKIISTPGKQDGLYWKNDDGTSGGPIGEPIARAIEEGYSVDKRSAYHGYYFKILKGQGPAAPLGRIDYVIEGVMIGGFAMIVAPAEYGVTGIKTFMVSNDGIVYEKDLGPNTLEIAKKIELYNPDKTWHPTDDQWPATPAPAEVSAEAK